MGHLLIPFRYSCFVSKITLIVIPVLWIVIVLMPIWSGSDFSFWSRSRSDPDLTSSYTQGFFTVIHSDANFRCFYLSHQCKMCQSFQYFGKHIEIFSKKYNLGTYLYIWLKWIQIRIRQNDTDSTGSGLGSRSTTPSYSPGTDTVATLRS